MPELQKVSDEGASLEKKSNGPIVSDAAAPVNLNGAQASGPSAIPSETTSGKTEGDQSAPEPVATAPDTPPQPAGRSGR